MLQLIVIIYFVIHISSSCNEILPSHASVMIFTNQVQSNDHYVELVGIFRQWKLYLVRDVAIISLEAEVMVYIWYIIFSSAISVAPI